MDTHQDGPHGDWGAVLAGHRDRLRRMVALRLDYRLQGRVDPSDIIQEAYLEAAGRLPEFAADPAAMPVYLWLRFLTLQQLHLAHRRHLGVQARAATREVGTLNSGGAAASSAALAAYLLGNDTRASEVAMRAERKVRVQEALDRMEPIDREILALRHFEQLTNGECARILGLSETAATKRHLRALRRLKELLAGLPGGLSGLVP
jgi:RNA polymerase sigma-70 factor (ECF subfamily)